jgi:hypothetical protein
VAALTTVPSIEHLSSGFIAGAGGAAADGCILRPGPTCAAIETHRKAANRYFTQISL